MISPQMTQHQPEDDDPPMFCAFTGSYCTGEHCEDYGCAKKAGFFDGEGDDDGIY